MKNDDNQQIDIHEDRRNANMGTERGRNGVNYIGGTDDKLKFANDMAESLPALLKDVFGIMDTVLINGASIYIAHPQGKLGLLFGQAIIDVGWHLHETLIWVKDTFVLGHCDYHYQHEPIYYGWKGKNRKWYVGRDKSTIFEIPRPKRSIEHPTMKPIELIEAHLENSTRKGDLVLDPFCGSGSTLIACERMARKARCVEIEPAYIAVTLERWHQMTDKMPSLYIKE